MFRDFWFVFFDGGRGVESGGSSQPESGKDNDGRGSAGSSGQGSDPGRGSIPDLGNTPTSDPLTTDIQVRGSSNDND